MGIKVTINEGIVNGQSFSIKLPDQPLIANTTGAAIRVTFSSDWNEYLNGDDGRGIKAVFSSQDTDPIAVYKENTGYWTSVTGLTNVFDIRLPAQTYSAPGFSMNIIGYQIDQNTQDQYSERYSTNPVYVRIYPSGPVSGSYIGLNPAIDWSDLVPTAISKADLAYNTVISLTQEITSKLSEVDIALSSMSLYTFITEVTTISPDNKKGVESQGIFNFVEATQHTQILVTDISNTNITVNNQTHLLGATFVSGDGISVTGTAMTDGNAYFYRDTVTNITDNPIVKIANLNTSDRGIGLQIKHNSADASALSQGAALDIKTNGAAGIRVSGGNVGFDRQVYIGGSLPTESNAALIIGNNEGGGGHFPGIWHKDGSIKATIVNATELTVTGIAVFNDNIAIHKTIHLTGSALSSGDEYVLNVANNALLIKQNGVILAADFQILHSSITLQNIANRLSSLESRVSALENS